MVVRRGGLFLSQIGRRRPFLFGVAVSAVKTCASDFFAQKVVEQREQVDLRRNFIFFMWGLLYLGGVQYFVYVHLFARRWFPDAMSFAAKSWREKLADRQGQRTVLKQVFLDQFVHHPFILFPAFYQVKEFIEGGTASEGWRKFRQNQVEDLKLTWSVWIPVFMLNFSFSPIWMRVPVVAIVSFGFTTALSCLRGAPETVE
ncbi:unnamed protein product [Durusdinium trenchii]|uniref:Uncharacterized protein n=2 Tax=Durusdinium trenchii TaxID=1381693 RepID=A0ABP0N619_9DINO